MDIFKHGIAFLLLVLTAFGTQATSSSPLLHLILPDKREIPLDEAALAALPQTEFETETPWTAGVHRYRGPTLKAMLAAQGLKDVTHVRVTGLNGYQQQFDLAPFAQVPLTLVRYQDGKPLTRRNKGPVWLLMPFSEYPEFDVSPIHSFMVWQLVRIEVIP
ncbi:molybdopterin-dependent oxidoreductase [Aeromonas rivipollensis]|uniref:molybdopterin-dependent oxidoreductase n=1 Tax=Aeromonas rivipollensis TaxID=948519 RepID=UPI000D130C07|nr:hypothetical protein [Aeromonas rivipollensis]AVP94163.1 hypothetical protein C7N77_13935 [Aeromonas rivipollensis]